jgi:hypothetical protein
MPKLTTIAKTKDRCRISPSGKLCRPEWQRTSFFANKSVSSWTLGLGGVIILSPRLWDVDHQLGIMGVTSHWLDLAIALECRPMAAELLDK